MSGIEEKKVEEIMLVPSDLEGLQKLQELGLVQQTTQTNDDDDCSSSCCWDKERVHLDEQGRVSFLNLGGKRLHRGIVGAKSIFEKFAALNTLNLGGTDLPPKDTVEMLNALTSLESLYLGGNGLGDAGATILAAWLVSEKAPDSLAKIDLRYNDITGVGTAALCEALQTRTPNNVIYLHLEGNQVDDTGCQALANLLKSDNCRLEQLFLGANHIGADGAIELACALQSNNTLSKLYLEGNNIGLEGADAFSKALEEMNGSSALKNLFSDNNGIGKEGAKRLAKALNSATAIPDGLED